MKKSHGTQRVVAATIVVAGAGLGLAPLASAEPPPPPPPGPAAVPPPPAAVEPAPAPAPGVVPPPPGEPVPAPGPTPESIQACSGFASALNYSSINYSDFANELALGNNHGNPEVDYTNMVGRTALRESAAVVLNNANTPGVAPEIADPMRAWSFAATKLLVQMGVRMPVDTINATATEMNEHANKVQFACAAIGTTA